MIKRAIAFLLLWTSPSFADGPTCAIAVRVAAATGEPLEGAVVRVETGMEALTDASGRVLFEGLHPTIYTLSALASGFYESGNQQIDLRESCRAELELTLALQVIVEETVVVSPEGQERVQIDAPVRADVVSGLHCERNVTRSLGEALMATVTGVRVENNCTTAGSPRSV